MKKKTWLFRVVVLLILLEMRLAMPQMDAYKYKTDVKVRVTGNIDNISQTGSNCKVDMGEFWFETEGKCLFSQRQKISVIGRTQRGVIDLFFGRIRLLDAIIDDSEKKLNGGGGEESVTGFFPAFREKIREIYQSILPYDEAGLVAGMVTGDKMGLSRGFYQQMVDSGTIHIVVASGYNVMLVAGAVMSGLFWAFRRSVATMITLGVMLGYVLLAGGEAPVVRAGVMAAVLYLGELLGRRGVSGWTLLLAGWAMIMVEPQIIEKASFQLSMMASVGLMVIYPKLMRLIDTEKYRLIGFLDKIGMMTTFSTMLTTAPVIWWHFNRVNLIGLLSNVLVLPLVPGVMVLGALALPFREIAAPFLYALSHGMIVIIRFFGK